MYSRIATFFANWDREPHVGGCRLQGASGFEDSDLVKELYEQDKPDTEAAQEALDETLENNTKWSGVMSRSKIPTFSVN